MAPLAPVWESARMAANTERKRGAQDSALAIARKLETLRPQDMSERQWTIAAGVSPSFFSNLRGTPTKPPSDPSVDQLRKVLRVAGVTLSEFFLSEAAGRLLASPSRQVLEQAFGDVWAGLPSEQDRQIAYLAETALRALGLPDIDAAKPGGTVPDDRAARVK